MNRLIETEFNTNLANSLRKLHPDWSKGERIKAEKVGLIKGSPNARPDILVRHTGGVPVVIETEFSPARTVEDDASSRLGLHLQEGNYRIEQSIALKAPEQLALIDQSKLEGEIEKTEFEFCVYSLNKKELDYSHRWPESGWIIGNLDDLADVIELTSPSENILDLGLNILQEKISDASIILRQYYGEHTSVLEEIAESLNQKDSVQTTRMAMAIVLNAIMFHKSLIKLPDVDSFEEIWHPVNEFKYDKLRTIAHWEHIVDDINYFPIFEIALNVLRPLDNKIFKQIFEVLYDASNKLEELGTTSRHDLCGRMFQRLITDRKFLATFYTLPTSAALLAEIAVDRIDADWSRIGDIESLRIADFACGTGALLNATLHSILNRHNRNKGDSSKAHKHLVEDVIVGTDIMPAATHLTASMIAGVHPENVFKRTSIFTLPYGKYTETKGIQIVSLGALDLFDPNSVLPTIFDTGGRKLTTKRGQESKTDVSQEIPDHSCDLVIMNPPFTRPTKHDSTNSDVPVPSFAGLKRSIDEQTLMSQRLKKLRTSDMVGHGNAGLASNFFDIAHQKVKSPDGVIALVLPSTILRGSSWVGVRQCLERHYKDIVIFCIASSGRTDRAFSADTTLSEVLIVATRSDNNGNQSVKLVNLSQRPKSIVEAVLVAKKVIDNPSASITALGNDATANVLSSDFLHACMAAGTIHSAPALTAYKLTSGNLVLPHLNKPIPLPVVQLREIGEVGLGDRDITGKDKNKFRGPFDFIAPPISNNPTYPMLWNHNAEMEKKLIVKPDSEGKIRENCEEDADRVWNQTKSRLHFNLDFGLPSQPLVACFTERESIGGRAWPNVILNDSNWEVPVLLWANTTLGLIMFWGWGSRQHIGRSILKRQELINLPVLDARKLSKSQLNQAMEIFNSFKDEEFQPASKAGNDPIRHRLDNAVLVEMMGLDKNLLPDKLELLRNQWCEEPSVHGGRSNVERQN